MSINANRGGQSEFWQNFYEEAWQFRADFMRQCLADGMNTFQSIKALEKMQRKHITRMDNETGKVSWASSKKPEHVLTGTPAIKTVAVYGQFVNLPFYTESTLVNMLIDIIDELGPFDSVMELGCGYGQNLFKMFYSGAPLDMQFYGGEFTNSGVQICKDLAAAEPKMKAEFFHFNHLEPKIDVNVGDRAFVFTCHTIEQVMMLPDNWFSTVASIAPHVTCVHFEPFGFQNKILGPASEAHKKFFIEKGWNLNFAQRISEAAKKGEITIDYALNEFSHSTDASNMTSLAVWHSDK